MAAPAHHVRYSYADYLALERASNVRHEFLDGQIYGMAGGTPEHAALAAAVIGILYRQLRSGPCRAHSSDLRVRVGATGLATYPDVAIVGGPAELDPEDPQAVTNPRVIVEILSASTESYDRGDKFDHYKQLPSLREYVLVSHETPRVEVWRRDAVGAWSATVATDGQAAELVSLGATLDVAELYEAVPRPRAPAKT